MILTQCPGHELSSGPTMSWWSEKKGVEKAAAAKAERTAFANRLDGRCEKREANGVSTVLNSWSC